MKDRQQSGVQRLSGPRHGSTELVGQTNSTAQLMPLDPANLPSLPEWLTSRLAMVSRQGWGKPGTLPQNHCLSSKERQTVEGLRKSLEATLSNTSLTHRQTANEVLGAITKMLLALPSKGAGEATGEAKADAYMIAIEDMPAWAVTAAIRGWYRGEHGAEHNYTFAPAPAALRKLAMAERWKVAGRAKALGELLEAVPEVEFSDDHRKEMLNKMKNIGIGA